MQHYGGNNFYKLINFSDKKVENKNHNYEVKYLN